MSEKNTTYIEEIGGLPVNGHHMLSYVMGLALALFLTVAAYLIATHHIPLGHNAVTALLLLAILQFLVQMYFFLHLGANAGSAHRGAIFAYAVFIVLIIVVGSIWIMNSLNYRMMADPEAMMEYMHRQPGL